MARWFGLVILCLVFDGQPFVQAGEFTVTLGEPSLVRDASPGVPIYPWFPDGHITIFSSTNGMQMYWPGSSSYRTTGLSLDDMHLTPAEPLITRGGAKDDFDNGGAWLMSVIPLSDSHVIGFYHAEDHEWESGRSQDGVAWKSIAHCSSRDGGASWKKTGQIITSAHEKPRSPAWGGCGDHCVVFDKTTSRWFCFFQEHFICSAVSEDPHAMPGTWKKWDGTGFRNRGLGGKSSPIENLKSRPGGNPSVHFNTYLKAWFMVWHTWDGHIVYASSSDLVNWMPPVDLIKSKKDEKTWYPTVIGTSDTLAGQEAVLYYAYWPNKEHWQRRFLRRSIRFTLDGRAEPSPAVNVLKAEP